MAQRQSLRSALPEAESLTAVQAASGVSALDFSNHTVTWLGTSQGPGTLVRSKLTLLLRQVRS